MIDSFGRSIYQKIVVDPCLPIYSRLSPVIFTYLSLLTGILVFPLLTVKYSVSAFLMLMLSGYFDTLDGSVARDKNQTTPFGAALDITSDRVVEFSVVLGLYFYCPDERGLNCVFMLGSILFCVTTFLVVGIFTQNSMEKSFHYSPGLVERGEAFVFFSIMILLPAQFHVVSYLFSSLVFLTGALRLVQFKKAQ